VAKGPRAARHYQRKDSPLRLMADRWRPAIRRDVKASLLHLGELVPRERSVRYARAGDWAALKAHINWLHFREVLKAPFSRIIKLRHVAAEHGVRKINGSFSQARRRVRFAKSAPAVPLLVGAGGGGEQPPTPVPPVLAVAHVLGYNNDALQASASLANPDLASPRRTLDETVSKALGDRFNFDIADSETQDAIRAAQEEMIADLEAAARDAIDTIIRDGVAEGLDADEMVDDIRELIGLTDRQAQAVLNYENMLHELDPAALERQMRNVDYDAALEDAIDSGVELSDVAISRMVGDYLDNALDARAEMIAQTESVRAVSDGLSDAYQQAVDRGVLPEGAVTRYWQIALDEKTCPVCESIPDMNPDGVGVGEPFQSIDGPMDDPPDPHPNCRCSVDYITDMGAVAAEEEE